MATYTNYCTIPNDVLFEKNGITELFVESSTVPVSSISTPDLILYCEECGALVPFKRKGKHNDFHDMLDIVATMAAQ